MKEVQQYNNPDWYPKQPEANSTHHNPPLCTRYSNDGADCHTRSYNCNILAIQDIRRRAWAIARRAVIDKRHNEREVSRISRKRGIDFAPIEDDT